jgi:hypothetical protein
MRRASMRSLPTRSNGFSTRLTPATPALPRSLPWQERRAKSRMSGWILVQMVPAESESQDGLDLELMEVQDSDSEPSPGSITLTPNAAMGMLRDKGRPQGG